GISRSYRRIKITCIIENIYRLSSFSHARKLNNYRLYGIIQSLTCDSEGNSEKSREPGAVVNAGAAVGKSESRLHD
ncbi:MAG: hypothetical protein ACPGO0_05610, partial [Acidimicrobiales bacterium]